MNPMQDPLPHTILQWNCRGIRPNIDEIHILIQNFNPAVICLQETLLTADHSFSIRNFSIYNYVNTSTSRASGGTTILVSSRIFHQKINLDTDLQAVAVHVSISHMIGIYSIYLPPGTALNKNELDKLTNQIPTPLI